MKHDASNESFAVTHVRGIDVITLTLDAHKATMGGDGNVAEYFNRPLNIYDWQIMDSGYYG